MFRLLARPFAVAIMLFIFIILGWARDQCVAGASQHNIFGSLDTMWPAGLGWRQSIFHVHTRRNLPGISSS